MGLGEAQPIQYSTCPDARAYTGLHTIFRNSYGNYDAYSDGLSIQLTRCLRPKNEIVRNTIITTRMYH